jgi:peptide/nickel transport system substrate-binding protein
MPNFAILPAGTPADLEGVPPPATGPYVITDVGEDGSAVLERNPEFREWSADAQPAGFADRIEITGGIDPAEQVEMIEGGEADLGDAVPAELVDELDRRASDQLLRSSFVAVAGITVNTTAAPFDNADARRALAYALDRDELRELFAETVGVPENPVTCQVIPPNVPGYEPYCPFTGPGAEQAGTWAGPDLTEARALMRRSGTTGSDVVIAMSPALETTARQVAVTLRDLGYRPEVRIVDTDLFVVSPAQMPHDADISFTVWAWDYPSVSQFPVPLLGCTAPDGSPSIEGAGEFSINLLNFCDPTIDRRIEQALELRLTDANASARAFASIDRDLVDIAPMIPYFNGIQIRLVAERVGNAQLNPQIGMLLSQIWIR